MSYKGMEIIHNLSEGRVIVCWARFAVEGKYKIYKKYESGYRPIYATDSFVEALNYGKKVFCGT